MLGTIASFDLRPSFMSVVNVFEGENLCVLPSIADARPAAVVQGWARLSWGPARNRSPAHHIQRSLGRGTCGFCLGIMTTSPRRACWSPRRRHFPADCLGVSVALPRVSRDCGCRVQRKSQIHGESRTLSHSRTQLPSPQISRMVSGVERPNRERKQRPGQQPLPPWHGAQVAVDTPSSRRSPPLVLRATPDAAWQGHLDLTASCHLTVLGIELGVRWSLEASVLGRLLARHTSPFSHRAHLCPRTSRVGHFFLLGLLRPHDESLTNPRYLLRCHLPTRGPILGPQGQSAGALRPHQGPGRGPRVGPPSEHGCAAAGHGRPRAVLATASCTATDKALRHRRAHADAAAPLTAGGARWARKRTKSRTKRRAPVLQRPPISDPNTSSVLGPPRVSSG